MLEYIPIILIIVFAAVMGWRNRISVEEYNERKEKKMRKKKTPKYSFTEEQYQKYLKTGNRNYLCDKDFKED